MFFVKYFFLTAHLRGVNGFLRITTVAFISFCIGYFFVFC
jgi:hypothetical protein